MAKIIKVGSQNPTFTSTKIKKASPIHTHRNSNEVTNPFKFTNFEGNTLQFADVFEGFKPQSTSKLRIIASSVTGSMNKMRTGITEPIINFVNRVRGGIVSAWDYAKNTNISDVPGIKQMNDILNTPINMPHFAIYDKISGHIAGIRESINSKIGIITDLNIQEKWDSMIAKFQARNKYMGMEVLAIENAWKEEIALGGIV